MIRPITDTIKLNKWWSNIAVLCKYAIISFAEDIYVTL